MLSGSRPTNYAALCHVEKVFPPGAGLAASGGTGTEIKQPEELNKMPRKKRQLILSQPVREGVKAIKVRLDARTVITIASKKALEMWKQRYPNAVVIG